MQHNPYVRGALWSMGACIISVMNDVICKVSGTQLSGINILFFRFFFSTAILLPLCLRTPRYFVTSHWRVHALRGILFACAMLPWCYGLIQLPLPLVTTISFVTPLFTLCLAAFFLREKVGWKRGLATILGFCGVVVSVRSSFEGMNIWVSVALFATFLFATLDVVNKKMLSLQENIVTMMFYSGLWTTLTILPFVVYEWHIPSLRDMGLLLVLGMGANGLLWCLLKASQACDLSSLQSLRYTEFLFSCLASMLFFKQTPEYGLFAGVALIIVSNLYLTRIEARSKFQEA